MVKFATQCLLHLATDHKLSDSVHNLSAAARVLQTKWFVTCFCHACRLADDK